MIDITKLRNNRFIIIFKIKNVSKVMNNIKKIILKILFNEGGI